MPIEVLSTPYGRPALERLRAAIAAAKDGDPLAPVGVVVPSNHVGVTARRALASGGLGPGMGVRVGVAAVTFLTAYRLAELLGAPSLAAAGRRPVSTPVIAAALRRALRDDPGIFAPVAEHPATETALVATFAELSDVSEQGLFALAGAGRRAHDVVGLYRRARDRLAGAWYHESDLTAAAIAALGTAEGRALAAELGRVVVYLPQDLLQRQAALLAALAEACPTTVIAGLTGSPDADVGVRRSLARLGAPSPADPPPGPGVGPGRTRILSASDADDEVRAAVRQVVQAALDGTPLERIAVLYGTPQPYGRLVHEHLAAAGVPRNGASIRPLAASVVGRSLLDLLSLPDHDFRRADMLGVLARAPGRAAAPIATWERQSRQAGVVAGRAHWDRLLDRLAREHDHRADLLQESYDQAMAALATDDDLDLLDDTAAEPAPPDEPAGYEAEAGSEPEPATRRDHEQVPGRNRSEDPDDDTSAPDPAPPDHTAAETLPHDQPAGYEAEAGSEPEPATRLDHEQAPGRNRSDEPVTPPEADAEAEAEPVQPPSGVRRERRLADRAHELRRLALAIVDAVDDARSRPAPWSERVAWLRTLASDVVGGRPESRTGWPPDEVRAADSIDAALDRLAALDAVDHAPTLEVFRRTLELELDADLGRVGRLGEGVLVGPLSFAVGLDLDLVVVLGMAEGTLPATVHDDSLLPDAERARAGDQLPLRRERVGREHRRLVAALAAADRQLLCLPRGDLRASAERVPSRWLLDVAATLAGEPVPSGALLATPVPGLEVVPSFAHAVAHTSVPATDQEYRLRTGAARVHDPLVDRGAEVIRARRSSAFTRFDGNLAGVGVPSPVDEIVSSTRLESWSACPFAYFARRLLRVDPVEDPEHQLQMSALDRGSLVHEVLERFVTSVLARAPEARPGPGDDWTDEDHAVIRSIAEQVCDEFEARGATGRPVFWRRDRPQILALVDRFLHDDAARRRLDGTRPLAAEHAFGLGDDDAVEILLHDGRTLRFRGSADRIDEGPDGGLVVLDYKTGKADDYKRLGPDNPDDRGTRLQLAVYAEAARVAVGRPDAPVRSEYWFVSERGGFARHGYEVDNEVLARVATTLGTIVEGIERGAFPPHPDDQFRPWVVCPYCDPDGMGVAELRRQWERKREDPAVAAYAALAEGDLA